MNAVLPLRIEIAQEHHSDELQAELMPMLERNWKASASYSEDIVLAPNFERYKQMDKTGMVMCVTARDRGKLVGYAIWYIVTSFNYLGKSGHGVALFIEEGYRGYGAALLRRGELLLREQGIRRFYWFAKPDSLLYALLKAFGYTPDEVVMEKLR